MDIVKEVSLRQSTRGNAGGVHIVSYNNAILFVTYV